MKRFSFLISVFLILGCGDQELQSEQVIPEITAKADIFSIQPVDESSYEKSDHLIGSATFSQIGNVVTLEISLSGMEPNSAKAVHIHDGSVENPGRHWNQGSVFAACNLRSMGKLWAKPFIGDVGNVTIDEQGKGTLSINTDLWAINSGDEKDVLDKIIIVHDQPEDFLEECDPGHSHDHAHVNQKIGGGEIKLSSDLIRNIQNTMKTEQMPDFLICK